MKLGLISLNATRNLGDAAIYASLAQLAPERRVHCTLRETYPIIVRGLEHNDTIEDCDAFISVGWDGLSDSRKHLMTRRFLSMLARSFLHRDRTFVFGQSIPASCQGLSFKMLSAAFRRLTNVVVCDRRSYEMLKSCEIQADLSYDPAFVLRPQSHTLEAACGLLAQNGLDPQRVALISLHRSNASYDLDEEDCDKDLLFIAQQLAERGHQPAFLIQSDCDVLDSDKMRAMKFAQAAPDVPIVDPFVVEAPSSPCDVLISLLSLANIVVAVRYHSAILRLISGRVPFVLYDSHKGRDLSERLGLPGQMLASGAGLDLISAIEKTADKSFNPNPLARDVTEQFMNCIQKVGSVSI